VKFQLRLYVKIEHDIGDDNFHHHFGVVEANAHARSERERVKGEGIDLLDVLGQKAIGFEVVGVRAPDGRIAMNVLGANDGVGVARKGDVVWWW
jgi:hypothetical protein